MPRRRAIRRRHAGPALRGPTRAALLPSRCGMRRRPTRRTRLLPDSARRRAGASHGSGSLVAAFFRGTPTLSVAPSNSAPIAVPRRAAHMTIYKFINLTLPPTLEKRREVLEAFRTLAGQDDELVQRRRAEIAAIRREAEDIRRCIDAISRQMLELRAQILTERKALKYSPDQPRLPAGSPHGGEWTSGGSGSSNGSAANAAISAPHGPQRGPQYAALETETRTDAPANSGTQVAAGPGRPGYPVDLAEEEARGGHAIGAHVGRSEISLLAEVTLIAQGAGDAIDFVKGLREGSFPSLEAANKLVNATIAQNQAKIALVVSGLSPRQQLDAEFDSPTGYEAFQRTGHSAPYIRPTYGVRVVIVPDKTSPKGYRVDTAFPINF
jgi:hypothetical protein